jgi:hypothetical protein
VGSNDLRPATSHSFAQPFASAHHRSHARLHQERGSLCARHHVTSRWDTDGIECCVLLFECRERIVRHEEDTTASVASATNCVD